LCLVRTFEMSTVTSTDWISNEIICILDWAGDTAIGLGESFRNLVVLTEDCRDHHVSKRVPG